MATRTTLGCPRSCKHCAVPRIEGKFQELRSWPNLPVICDSNLTYASMEHFDRVMDRLLLKWDWVDFNQGLDARYLTDYHVERIGEINKKAMVRMSLDHTSQIEKWEQALHRLRSVGIPQKNIRTYILVGFDSDPQDAWYRCEHVESFIVPAFPMWYHALDQMEPNIVTRDQEKLGWNDYERRRIMQWFYHHKKAVK